MAPYPGDKRGEEDRVAVLLSELDPLGEAQGDQALAEHMFHRLTHSEVDAE